MLIAGEPSGDLLAAELVKALRRAVLERQSRPAADAQPLQTGLAPVVFGAGGPKMAEAGVTLAVDMTPHAVIGLWEVLKNYAKFRRLFQQLLQLAVDRQPDAIVCVDFSGFNRRFAHAVKAHVRAHRGPFYNWNPRIIQYVSPQVWASRPGRARAMADDFDLLLSIFPFEKQWYVDHAPGLRVEFVGHPIVDRYATPSQTRQARPVRPKPLLLLLPGSRPAELKRHLPIMVEAARRVDQHHPVRREIVLPNDSLVEQARTLMVPGPGTEARAGGLAESLTQADLAIASTGTVTLECAYFGLPTIAVYKTSWSTYQIGRRIVRVKHLAMPNLLANEEIFPEFIQHEATAENLARAALDLLNSPARREAIRSKLATVIASLGPPGANQRAAESILNIL